MPCSTTHPCSEELVAVLPCPPRPRGTLGKYSSPLPGSCGPIPQVAQPPAGRGRGPKVLDNEVNEGATRGKSLNLAQTGAAGRPSS